MRRRGGYALSFARSQREPRFRRQAIELAQQPGLIGLADVVLSADGILGEQDVFSEGWQAAVVSEFFA